MNPAQIDPIAKRDPGADAAAHHEGTGAGGFSNNWSRRQTFDTKRNNFDFKVNLNRTNAHQMWFKLSYMYAPVAGSVDLPDAGCGLRTMTRRLPAGVRADLGAHPDADLRQHAGHLDPRPGSIRARLRAGQCRDRRARDSGHERPEPDRHAARASVRGAAEHRRRASRRSGPRRPGRRRPGTRRRSRSSNNLTKFAGKHEFRGGYTCSGASWTTGSRSGRIRAAASSRPTNATRMANITGQTSANFYNQFAALMFGLTSNMGKSVQNEIFSVYEWTHALLRARPLERDDQADARPRAALRALPGHAARQPRDGDARPRHARDRDRRPRAGQSGDGVRRVVRDARREGGEGPVRAARSAPSTG